MGHVGLHAALVILGAVLVDAAIGEVPNRVHPVVGIGSLTRRVLSFWPATASKSVEFSFGILLVSIVVFASGLAALALGRGLQVLVAWTEQAMPSPFGQALAQASSISVEAVALSTMFAGRGLVEAGRRMRNALARSLEEGRVALSHLCSRDPQHLGREELCGATVESLSENASDSFVAPLFWYVCLTLVGASGLASVWGLVGAAVYRASNTLDAMVGYRGKYEYVGKFAARLDDVLNWVPARLTALTLLAAAALCRLNVAQAGRVAWREHAATESPNAGWPMALAAGALGVELTKRDCYVLGKGLRAPQLETIAGCERLIRVGFGLFAVAASAVVMGAGHG